MASLGITATRTDSKVDRHSACDIVGEALGKPYYTVASIRTRYLKSPVRRYHAFLGRPRAPGPSSWDIRTTA